MEASCTIPRKNESQLLKSWKGFQESKLFTIPQIESSVPEVRGGQAKKRLPTKKLLASSHITE